MPLQPNSSAPYTTSAAITAVLDAWRVRGFSVPVSVDTLIRAGVSESLGRRTLQSLVSLELVDESGNPTATFDAFKATRGEDEYKARFQEWLRSLYADVLQYTIPSVDSPERVAEAFRTYEPAGQRRAMAALFIGLWKYGGLPVPEGGSLNRVARPARASYPSSSVGAVRHSNP